MTPSPPIMRELTVGSESGEIMPGRLIQRWHNPLLDAMT
jgi:hypothetical protein